MSPHSNKRGLGRLKGLGSSPKKWLPLAAVPGIAAVMAGCGALATDQLQTLLSNAELSIQGTKPLGSIIDAISGGRVGLRDLSRAFAAPGASRSALLEGDPQVALPVLDNAGLQIGTLTLSDARLVLREIKVKTVGGLESADESTGRIAKADESEDESGSEEASEEESEAESEDEDGDASENADGETEAEFTGPFIVNLLSDTVSPDLSTLEIPVGIYKEVSMKIHKLEDADGEALVTSGALLEGDALLENSVTLTGMFDPGTPEDIEDDVPFTFTDDVDEEFELEADEMADGGIDVAEGAINSIVIAFRMAKWVDFTGTGVDFLALSEAAGEAGIVLDSSSEDEAGEVQDAIKESIKNSADFGKDDDGDGRLESDEDSDEESAEELEQEDEDEEEDEE